MNDMNKKELSRYVRIETCDYIIDTDLPSDPLSDELKTWVNFI